MNKLLTRLTQPPWPKSYRGRYLLLLCVLSCVLLTATLIGQSLVRDVAERNALRSSETARLLNSLNDVRSLLDQLHGDLLNFVIDPAHTDQKLVEQSAAKVREALQSLQQPLRQYDSPILSQLLQSAFEDMQQLSALAQELASMRLSNEQWVPATGIMNDILVPQNKRFRTHLQSLLWMLDALPNTAEVQLQVRELESYWLSLVGEIRLLIANRFGVFDIDTLGAMRARERNAQTFEDAADQQLKKVQEQLREFDDAVLLGELKEMGQAFILWRRGTKELSEALRYQDWRRDTFYLHHAIEPVIQRIHDSVGQLQLQIQQQAQQLLDQALDNNSVLATAMASVAAVVIGVMLLGYWAFKHWLLNPIEHIAKQMQREAQGHLPQAGDLSPVSETRALMEAFAHMHREVRARQRRLDYLAHHDPLTDLPNRTLFRDRLEHALQQPLEEHQSIALLFLDLDRFKQINDSHGHLVGDKLLIEVAQRLRSVFRVEDTVARVGGDEFAVLLHSFSSREELAGLAQKVVEALRPSFHIHNATYHTSASIGLTLAPQDGSHADQLIQHADAAMYQAKAAGRSGYCHFTHDIVERSAAQLNLETELHIAVQQEQLEIYLQPVVDLRDGLVHASECLMRWHHPQRGVLSPADFLPTLEDIGLLQRITDWTLEQLARNGITHEQSVSVNLPAKLLQNEAFARSLQARIRDGRLVPQHLIVEITEDSFSVDVAAAAQLLHKLHELGVRIALDDFGTGQSSLSHLRAFPFDLVKIDRSFIQEVDSNPQDATLVHAVIVLATTLGMKVVGEGIETTQQRDLLRDKGCHYGQGYLFSVPAPMATRVGKTA